SKGRFVEPGRTVWLAEPRLKYAQTLTCGDVDGDGDLDVWLGQYKVPYEKGQMPNPYYDANDGHPSYLLLNDGRGNFSDATARCGLAEKRFRRTYSGSFVDLDEDHDLDLLVVSDFAGAELYHNDGAGNFSDATRDLIGGAAGFGMAHCLADFNRDARLDLLMIGMNSPTADRLDFLKLFRPGHENDRRFRPQMTFGNRLFTGRADGRFEPASMNALIARAGWAWGCSAFDFDNDSWPDVYIANGHETLSSVREYEPEFWLHDIYVGRSQDDRVVDAYFISKARQTRGQGWSYGGNERNRFYLNETGESFLEVAHLLGVALPEDSRNVVTEDLDQDGRVDLLVTTFEAWPVRKQTLRVFRNQIEPMGHWIGFRFPETPRGSAIGASVKIQTEGFGAVRQIVTGDSFRAQHAPVVHFGLGHRTRVERIEVRWTGERSMMLENPAIDRYHSIIPSP
ncbi:MAG: CRTAC1 family protein, partial [Verrucomicrobiota bacterium]